MGRSQRSTSSLLVLGTVVHTVEDCRGRVSGDYIYIYVVRGCMRMIRSWTHSDDLPGRHLQFDLFICDEHRCMTPSTERYGLYARE